MRICIYICMVKVISLSNEAYGKLKMIKGNKSFSEVVVELVDEKKIKRKGSLVELAGIWKGDDYWEDFKKEIRKDRDKMKLREVKL